MEPSTRELINVLSIAKKIELKINTHFSFSHLNILKNMDVEFYWLHCRFLKMKKHVPWSLGKENI
jgi:hypothetical protein